MQAYPAVQEWGKCTVQMYMHWGGGNVNVAATGI